VVVPHSLGSHGDGVSHILGVLADEQVVLGVQVNAELGDFLDVGLEFLENNFAHELKVHVEDFDKDLNVVVLEELHENRVSEEFVFLDNGDVGHGFFESFELLDDKGSDTLAGFVFEFGELGLEFLDGRVALEVVILDIFELFVEFADVLNVVFVNVFITNIVDELGLQKDRVDKLFEGFLEVSSVVEGNVHVEGLLLEEGHFVFDVAQMVLEA